MMLGEKIFKSQLKMIPFNFRHDRHLLLYLQKEVLVFKSRLWYIMGFFLVIARIQNLLRLSCVLSLSNVRIKRQISTYVHTA